jgi:hypothetical protein
LDFDYTRLRCLREIYIRLWSVETGHIDELCRALQENHNIQKLGIYEFERLSLNQREPKLMDLPRLLNSFSKSYIKDIMLMSDNIDTFAIN